MPRRATKRGSARTSLDRDCDVLICGASFAGLAVARELAGSGASVTVIDRYQIGERATSACGIPTRWLEAMQLDGSVRQTFSSLVVHTPWTSCRWQLPWTLSTFDYAEMCNLLWAQSLLPAAAFETATVTGRDGHTVHTDRGELRAPLIVDALGWRRVLSAHPVKPPHAPLTRAIEVHPRAGSADIEVWIDERHVRAGYSWSFPAAGEMRVGVGSYWPARHVKTPTQRLAEQLGLPAANYQGNWIPHELRPAVEGGVFFVGDSAGHCFPLTAEGIRPALYFGLACGAQLRAVLAGQSTAALALGRYGAFSAAHARTYRRLLSVQRFVTKVIPRRVTGAFVRANTLPPYAAWWFNRYLDIAPPSYAEGRLRGTAPSPARRGALVGAAG